MIFWLGWDVNDPDEFIDMVSPPGEEPAGDDRAPFLVALDYAVSWGKKGYGEQFLDAMRKKWPKDVEKVLTKAAVA
jgi:hypothetical protein